MFTVRNLPQPCLTLYEVDPEGENKAQEDFGVIEMSDVLLRFMFFQVCLKTIFTRPYVMKVLLVAVISLVHTDHEEIPA